MDETRRCPFCGEVILIIAKKCKHCGEWLEDRPYQSHTSGTTINEVFSSEYEILEELGRGGMATVYKARQKSLDRIVALKVIHREFSGADRFQREAIETARLRHNNIVTVHDIGEIGNYSYIAMEYLSGDSYTQFLKSYGPPKEDIIKSMIIPILDALEYTHGHNIIHRDVKSNNIMLDGQNKPVLMDFGIAFNTEGTRYTQAGGLIGTPEYMSPEQANEKFELDGRSDLYSLGVVMYELATGRVPFVAEKAAGVVHQIIHEAVPDPRQFNKKLSDGFVSILLRALAKNPDERFQNASDFKRALLEGSTRSSFELLKKDSERREKKHVNDSSSKIRTGMPLGIKIVLIALLFSIIAVGTIIVVSRIPKRSVKMYRVAGGSFHMGSEDGDQDEKPIHRVSVNSFYMSKHEITQELYYSVMGTNPSRMIGEDLPVESVTWIEATDFCNKLSLIDGLNPCYDRVENVVRCRFSANGYRLPTEAEWEYAARGGKKSHGNRYAGASNPIPVCWYSDNSGLEIHPVGEKRPNELGLYDMSGNVWEWCWDAKSSYSSNNQTNPTGPGAAYQRVLRGGSFNDSPSQCRVSVRFSEGMTESASNFGFRVVRSIVK